MNCPKCGSVLAPGALFCPVCNEPVAAGYTAPQGYPEQQPTYPPQGFPTGYQQGFPQQGYPQQSFPQQGFPQQGYPQQGAGGYPPVNPGYPGPQGYQTPFEPQGYQQPYTYGEQRPNANPLLTAISELPHSFMSSIRSPAGLMRELLERNDTFTCPIVAGVVLLVSFLCGMTVMRGVVGTVFSLVSTLTGVTMASDASSMNQGINYVAGRIAPSVGGIAALCQLIAMLVPTIVTTVYLTFLCKLRFSWPAALGLIAIPSFVTVAAALLSMLLSLLTPWLSLVCILCGVVINYLQLGALLSYLTGRDDAQLFHAKAVCFVISIAASLLIMGLAGGSLMNVVLDQMLRLLTNVGSLI
ncbi:MAG: hypothetical protein PHI98_03800 [Eubacteriales bacterium]|nr:hypothetical protein [Eubacteriales bacterium]